MNPGMKMLMLTNARKGASERSGGRMDYAEGNYARMGYDSAEGNYWPENRFRDRRGREHYDNGRFAPRNEWDNMDDRMGDPESRRRRDSRGRFRSEMDDDAEDNYGRRGGKMEMGYPNRPFPVYEGGGERMNQIGFYAGPEVDSNYRMDAGYHGGSEMEYRNSTSHMGRAESTPKLTKESAEEWARGMENEDGTKGAHWTLEQAKQVMAQRGVSMDPVQFWIALNAMYSDYSKVLKKHGVGDKIDLYVDLAKAFVEDKDAQPEKLARYYEYVVKH